MSESIYKKSITAAVRGLWSGVYSISDFEDAMKVAIQRNLAHAWLEGALEYGLNEEDLSDEEIESRNSFIEDQFSYIIGFAEYIHENDKINGGKLRDFNSRIELWVRRYAELYILAKTMAGKDKAFEWRTNVHCKEHCTSCLSLNGKVKRGSYWQKTIMPRSRDLECGGWRCCCELVETDKPLSRGKVSF